MKRRGEIIIKIYCKKKLLKDKIKRINIDFEKQELKINNKKIWGNRMATHTEIGTILIWIKTEQRGRKRIKQLI